MSAIIHRYLFMGGSKSTLVFWTPQDALSPRLSKVKGNCRLWNSIERHQNCRSGLFKANGIKNLRTETASFRRQRYNMKNVAHWFFRKVCDRKISCSDSTLPYRVSIESTAGLYLFDVVKHIPTSLTTGFGLATRCRTFTCIDLMGICILINKWKD